MKLEGIKKQSLPEEIVNHFLDLLLSGELKDGDRLTSEREISRELDISRSTLREGLKILELMGIIEKKNRKNIISLDDSNLMKESLEIHFCSRDIDYLELLELREIIETETVKLAAQKARTEDIEKLKYLYEKMNDCRGDWKNYVSDDVKFHIAIAKATQNKFLYEIFSIIREILYEYQKSMVTDKKVFKTSLNYHAKILNAIKGGNQIEAYNYMNSHLNFTKKLFIESLQKEK